MVHVHGHPVLDISASERQAARTICERLSMSHYLCCLSLYGRVKTSLGDQVLDDEVRTGLITLCASLARSYLGPQGVSVPPPSRGIIYRIAGLIGAPKKSVRSVLWTLFLHHLDKRIL